MLMDKGGKEHQHVNILVEVDLMKPLLRGTILKHRQAKCWAEFKYENLPLFCLYCASLGIVRNIVSRGRKM